METIQIQSTPFLPEASLTEIHYRKMGSGPVLLFLHGGWGYEVYPFERQIDALRDHFTILIPDRSGYGKSGQVETFPTDFHRRGAYEMLQFLDALGAAQAVLWGHSDGAVIAAMMGLIRPEGFSALILEAFHYYRVKPGSRDFFEAMVEDPSLLGERTCSTLAREHGEDYWGQLINNNGRAWQQLAETSLHPKEDLYAGRLSSLRVATLFIHGKGDPRTEPGELDRVRQEVPYSFIEVIEQGKHSPHSESAAADEATAAAKDFLKSLGLFQP